MEKLRIMGLSDYGSTGISESLNHQLRHWHDQGHEVWRMVLGFNGWTAFADPEVYPYRERLLRIVGDDNPATRFGQGCLPQAVERIKPDIVISSFDVWMVRYLMQPHLDPVVKQMGHYDAIALDKRTFKHILYFPLDGLVENTYLPRGLDEMILGADVPVTYSRFAQRGVLRDTGVHIPFIPIAHDPDVYCPGSKVASRVKLNLPTDKFIVGMVGTNQYRKLWGEFFEAAARLARKYDDVVLIPWTTWNIQICGGFDIEDLVFRNGVDRQTINPKEHIGQFNDSQMADLYRAMDVCVLTTVGEGAGLPPIRARACGTPALVSDNTSNTEFAADPFELIPSTLSHLDNGSNIARFKTDTDVLFERLETLYKNRTMLRDLGAKCAAAMEPYSTPVVLPQWDSLLESL